MVLDSQEKRGRPAHAGHGDPAFPRRDRRTRFSRARGGVGEIERAAFRRGGHRRTDAETFRRDDLQSELVRQIDGYAAAAEAHGTYIAHPAGNPAAARVL